MLGFSKITLFILCIFIVVVVNKINEIGNLEANLLSDKESDLALKALLFNSGNKQLSKDGIKYINYREVNQNSSIMNIDEFIDLENRNGQYIKGSSKNLYLGEYIEINISNDLVISNGQNNYIGEYIELEDYTKERTHSNMPAISIGDYIDVEEYKNRIALESSSQLTSN